MYEIKWPVKLWKVNTTEIDWQISKLANLCWIWSFVLVGLFDFSISNFLCSFWFGFVLCSIFWWRIKMTELPLALTLKWVNNWIMYGNRYGKNENMQMDKLSWCRQRQTESIRKNYNGNEMKNGRQRKLEKYTISTKSKQFVRHIRFYLKSIVFFQKTVGGWTGRTTARIQFFPLFFQYF